MNFQYKVNIQNSRTLFCFHIYNIEKKFKSNQKIKKKFTQEVWSSIMFQFQR